MAIDRSLESGSSAGTSLDRVVGLGASAGGLEALQEVMGSLSTSPGMAVIIAQHLAPDHPSSLALLLTSASGRSVVEAIDDMPLRPGVVCVVPSNRDAIVVGDRVRLVEPPPRTSPSPSIDRLFESLADEWGPRSVGVVLSGTGVDGAQGLRAIRGADGLTMVQTPETARFDGMPRAAIGLGGVDLVASAADIGNRLGALFEGGEGAFAASVPEPGGEVLSQIAARLRHVTGIDFAGYKPTTLTRQIQRRMAVRQVSEDGDYAALLMRDLAEAQALADNLLVTVTSFFRDDDAFAALRSQVTDYVTALAPTATIRVWIPGCATGEEAYSIGMLISEALGRPMDLPRRLKIFASDIHEPSLGIGRQAWYPASEADRVPPELLSVYTRAVRGGVQMVETLRECVVFARHDVTNDPPFPSIDLVSCRNTLIYFTRPTQDRVLGCFEFAVKPGGILFLGAVESLDRGSKTFRALDADNRIYTRIPGTSPRTWQPVVRLAGSVSAAERKPELLPPPESSRLTEENELLEALVRLGGTSFLVFDQAQNLVRVGGDVSGYCTLPAGRLAAAGGAFLRPELRDEARALFLLCRADGRPVTGQQVVLPDSGVVVRMRATPVPLAGEEGIVVSFAREDDVPGVDEVPARTETFERELERLERELLISQDSLRRSLGELQATNEELEASAEELQAASEELQSSNEELQASNEEIQATNEELGTLNLELTKRTESSEALTLELENIQASLSQGMVLLDRDLCVRRYTPMAVRLFALVDTDIGRPLLSVPTTSRIEGLHTALRAVLGGEPRRSLETVGGAMTYLLQVLPYLDSHAECVGVIVTMTDISEMVGLRRAADDAFSDLEAKSELLADMAATDSLTGLGNRRAFLTRISRAVDRAERSGRTFALVELDLDRFKEVNDEMGHAAGDLVLAATASRITDVVRGTDSVARLGGDEFGVLLEDFGHPAELELIVDRLRLSLEEPVDVGDRIALSSASIGVALFPRDGRSEDELIRAADAAMYAQKRRGGDGFSYFDTSMNEAAEIRRRTRLEVAAAIEAREFEMHYQPIVDAVTRQVRLVEALVRWRRRGVVVAAADFVPFCEESRQVRALGEIVAELVSADLPELLSAGPAALRICVNVSVEQLEERGVNVAVFSESLHGHLDRLVVEILETVFLPNHPIALDRVRGLAGMGAQIAIDDYGSGYSNMLLLESLSPDYIKLDRTFLGEGRTAADRLSMIRSAVDVAHVVGSQVIAEGIETEEQLHVALDAGVDLIQGYHVGGPMPLAELLDFLASDPA